MIEARTVLVLGAGASAPYGMPVGRDLSRYIKELPAQELDRLPVGQNDWVSRPGTGEAFKRSFDMSRQYSIDAFLGHRPEFEAVGKFAIATLLLRRESIQKILTGSPDDDWYSYLLAAMDAPWGDFTRNKIAFITFNYDRTLEAALLFSLQERYGKSEDEVRAALSSFPIVHVYGQLGSLDPESSHFVPLGGGENRDDYLRRASQGIRVMSEGRDDSPEFEQARALLGNAEALCFLGFGFDALNVRRLGGREIGAGGHRLSNGALVGSRFAASAFGLTIAECNKAGLSIAQDVWHGETAAALVESRDRRCVDTLRNSLILG